MFDRLIAAPGGIEAFWITCALAGWIIGLWLATII